MCKHDPIYQRESEEQGGAGCPLCHRERRTSVMPPAGVCPVCAPKQHAPAFSDMIIVETCPVCGVRFVTAQSGPFVCPDCLTEQAGYEADRADNARPYLN